MKFYNAEILGTERTQRIQNATKAQLGEWLKFQLPGVKLKALPDGDKSVTQDIDDSDYKIVLEVAKNESVGDDPGVLPVNQSVELNDMTQPITPGKSATTKTTEK